MAALGSSSSLLGEAYGETVVPCGGQAKGQGKGTLLLYLGQKTQGSFTLIPAQAKGFFRVKLMGEGVATERKAHGLH